MRASIALGLAAALTSGGQLSAATVHDMQWHRRIIMVSVPRASDPSLLRQRWLVARWRQGAADRDVSVVEIIGDKVTGSDNEASQLRSRYGLQPTRFVVALIGKDGHVAARSSTPFTAGFLQRTIDAMPMRRAGER